MEKISIENFGPIAKAEIEIRDINIFIGTTSSGKSTVAKLISIFRDNSLDRINEIEQFNKLLKDYNIDFPVKPSTKISYQYNDFYFEVKKDGIFTNNYTQSEGRLINSIYIPAERIFFPTITQSIYNLFSNDISLPKWFINFGAEFEKARNSVRNLPIDFLNVSYEFDGSVDYIKLTNEDKLQLSQASSGLQSVIPLILVIKYNTAIKSNSKNMFVIEEPELNLYPSSQKDLTEFIIAATNQSDDKLIITTHSPYLLTTLDNLIQANNVVKFHPELKKEVSNLVPENYWINYDQVSCYFFDNGTARSTMDEETQSIGPSNIDNVSERLSETFERLLALKYQES
jgi:predicted ATP-dependent endonuclease of OLD family